MLDLLIFGAFGIVPFLLLNVAWMVWYIITGKV